MSRRRPRRSRLLGLLLLLLLLEGAWQLTALLVAAAGREPLPPTDPDAGLVVLCAGDSNTYGLHVHAWSYPAQLEARLEPRYAGGVQVVNRGVPGANSAQVAERVGADLSRLEPDLVLLLAGVNDAWNADAFAGTPWWRRLKLVEFAANLLAGDTTAGDHAPRLHADEQGRLLVEHEGELRPVNPGGGDLLRTGDALAASVRRELGRAVEAARAAGARPVLMTYAEDSGNHATVNAAVRALAAERDVLLVDHAARFAEAFAAGRYAALMFNDKHPNIAGYELMAEGVVQALDGAGWIPPAPADPVPRADRPAPAAPELELLGDGSLRLRGPPGWAWQLLVAPPLAPGAEPLEVPGHALPLAAGPVLDTSRAQPTFAGRFDASGSARVHVPAGLHGSERQTLRAQALLLRDPAEPAAATAPVAAVSEPLELPPP